jgi:hypothetical protein
MEGQSYATSATFLVVAAALDLLAAPTLGGSPCCLQAPALLIMLCAER